MRPILVIMCAPIVIWSVTAYAADDWKARLKPMERACLTKIESTEGPVSGIKTASSAEEPKGTFNLLLMVDRSPAESINIRCQGSSQGGTIKVTDVTRE